MESLYLLIPLSIMVVAFAVWIFFGAADSGQFDDLESPGWRILGDDDGGAQVSSPALPADEQPGGAVVRLYPASSGTAAEHRGQSPLKSNTGL
ncbi:cbb3-type cytochrome oxidase assembly protein CcoS [uncultured Massilia sp.]|uniref:cbb3-type cytochrome oxidase assembly protein CcoS n=1 Tax=uncultured Massilia sp. TaxID=169973 RepID=UPI0035A35D23